MNPVNANGAPLIGNLSIAQLKLAGNRYENLDTHYFHRGEQGTEWNWRCRPPKRGIENRATAPGLFDLLVQFLKNNDLGENIGIVIKTSENAADGPGSICKSDALKLIAACALHTKILNVVIDGQGHAAPKFARSGPVRDTTNKPIPAIYIPLIPGELFVVGAEPLISNVAMTDHHNEEEQWHVWETLFKSGNNYFLFQSELGHDDRVFHETSIDGIPTSLLERASSFEIPSAGPDLQPIDHWGQLLILDSARALLP